MSGEKTKAAPNETGQAHATIARRQLKALRLLEASGHLIDLIENGEAKFNRNTRVGRLRGSDARNKIRAELGILLGDGLSKDKSGIRADYVSDNDTGTLWVSPGVRDRLRKIHEATVTGEITITEQSHDGGTAPAEEVPLARVHRKGRPESQAMQAVSEAASRGSAFSTDTSVPDILRILGLDQLFNAGYGALRSKEHVLKDALCHSVAATDADRIKLLTAVFRGRAEGPTAEMLSLVDRDLQKRGNQLTSEKLGLETRHAELLARLAGKKGRRAHSPRKSASYICPDCGTLHTIQMRDDVPLHGQIEASAEELRTELRKTEAALRKLGAKDQYRSSLSIYEHLLDAMAGHGEETVIFVVQPEGTSMLYISLPHSGGFVSELLSDQLELAMGMELQVQRTERSVTFHTSELSDARIRDLFGKDPFALDEKSGNRRLSELIAFKLAEVTERVTEITGLRFYIKAVS